MIRDINKLVNIPGELNSPAEGNIVTWSKGVYDYPLEKDQQTINSHVYEIESELDNIANEISTINQSINEINSTNNRIITINQIDTLVNGDLYKSTNPINYAVITPFISNNYKIGNLVLVSNDTGEKLVQIFATSLEYDNQNGTLNINNYNDNIVLIYRIYNNLTQVGQESGWTRWNYVNENITNESIKYIDQDLTGTQKMTVLSNIGLSIFDEINSSNLQNEPNQFGLTPGFPKRIPSLKAVWDLFKTIENTGLQKVSFENLNSLGDLEDTTTDKSSLYTIYNVDQYDQEYTEGLLFVYANLNEKLISQIVIGPYEITPNNHRTLRRISINTIGKFNILSRNRPYENASSRFSEWSVEDYIGYVKYNESQELTENYKNTARENIGITIDDDTSSNEAVTLPDNSTGLPTSRYVQKALNALQNVIVTTITQNISSVNSNINDINNNINSINENIGDINNDVDGLTEQLNGLENSIISYNLNKDVTTDNENNLIFANRYTADGSKNLVYLPENLIYQGIPYILSIVNGIYDNVYDDNQQVDNILKQGVIWDTNSRKFYLMVKSKSHQINQLINTVYYRNWPATGIYYSSDYYTNNINNQNITFYVQDDNWGSQWSNDSHWIKIVGNQIQQAQAPNNLQSYNWISADTFEEENTIYVIRYNFNLKNTSASIGNNSVLRFEGGKLYNGTLVGNSSVYLDLNEAVSTQSMEVFSGDFANYGENFPSNPYIGQTFYNTIFNKQLIFNGTEWLTTEGRKPIENSGNTLPVGLTSSDKGSIFYKNDDDLYYWNGAEWKTAGKSGLIKVSSLPESGNSDKLYLNTLDNIIYTWENNEWESVSVDASKINTNKYISFDDLDTLTNQQLILSNNCTQYFVYNGPHNVVMGLLTIISDSLAHTIMQVLYTPDDILNDHSHSESDYKIRTYYRYYGLRSPHSNVWSEWKELNPDPVIIETYGNSANKPVFDVNSNIGFQYFDTTINMPVYWNGRRWFTATGKEVAYYTGTYLERPTNLDESAIGVCTYYDTSNDVILIYCQDEKGHDLWTTTGQQHVPQENYSILPYTGNISWGDPYNIHINDGNNADITGEGYYDYVVHDEILDSDNIEIYYYKSNSNAMFLAKPIQPMGSQYDEKGYIQINSNIYTRKWYALWKASNEYYDSDYYQNTLVSINNAEDIIWDTPYFLNYKNSKYYKYNKNTNKLEEIEG